MMIALIAVLASLAPPAHAGDGDALGDHPGRAAFLVACARCHGEDGSGRGTTELDRPARSFQDGGFSFGNTPEAIMRTIRGGIPGSPMPAFEGAWDELALRDLADFVIALGPEQTEVSRRDTVLAVGERARVVRGLLPPITETATETVRGLLVGLPDGLSFEYRYDDVRLLGVRWGELVERTDWTGRGGTPLQPLGRLVWTRPDGPGALAFARVLALLRGRDATEPPRLDAEDAAPLEIAGRGTRVDGARAQILVSLRRDGIELVAGTLEPRAIPTSLGAGFAERWTLHPRTALRVAFPLGAADPALADFTTPLMDAARAPALGTPPVLATPAAHASAERAPARWIVTPRDEGVEVLVVVTDDPDAPQIVERDGARLLLAFADPRADGAPVTFEIARLLLPAWTDEARATLTAELPR